jgi:hypothetical protein
VFLVLTFIATAFAAYYTREQWLTAVRSASCAHRCDGFAYEESIGKIPAYDFSGARIWLRSFDEDIIERALAEDPERYGAE